MEGDRVVGVISLKDLLRFLNLKLELEDNHAHGPRPDGRQFRQAPPDDRFDTVERPNGATREPSSQEQFPTRM
jgi:hypothetical protein